MSLTLRLTATYLLITLVGLLLLGAGFVALAGAYLGERRERELEAQAEIYAGLLGELAASPAALQALAPTRAGAELLPPGTAARVFSTTGALLAGDPALGPFPSRAALPLVRPPVPLPASQAEGRRYAARTIEGPGGPIGVLELSRDTADDARLLAALRGIVLQASLLAALVAAAVSALLARSIARPIVAQTRRAETLAATVGTAPALAAPQSANPPIPHASTPPRSHSPDSSSSPNEIAALSASLDQLEAGLEAYVARIGELEQARTRFYRSVSHELRTPLTALRAGLENLADAAPELQRPAFAALEDETARLGRLVDELLRPPDDGRLAVTARVPADLDALAAEVCALLAGRAARAGVVLRAENAPVFVHGDRDRLKQALINLLDNALRATPPGGAIQVDVRREGSLALLAVEDDGPGVPVAQYEQIWERGVRGAGPAGGGAGLGLAIVREIAAAHGGRAYLDPAHTTGARFVIELPALQ